MSGDITITLTELVDGVSVESTPQSITVYDGVFVDSGGGAGGAVSSVNGETGAVLVATTAQGALADTAVQPEDIGTAATHASTDFDAAGAATTAQATAEAYTDTAIASEVTRADAAYDEAGAAAAAQAAAEAYADGLSGGGSITSEDITDATTVGKAVLTATDAATARTAIGAGTSSLAIGTSSTTALAGNTAIPSTPADIGAATAAQGALADSAIQPADIGTAAAADTGDFDAAGAATTAQTAAEGYTDTAIASEVSRADAAYATAAQGGKADSATQPGDLATVATSGAYSDLSGTPSIPDSADDIGAVPTTRTVNGHALSADVALALDDLTDVDTTTDAPTDGQALVWDDGSSLWVPGDVSGGGGGGSVATDTVFDAKGDLAVGTGSDTAAKLPAGANGARLTPDSGQTTGLKWITPPRNPDDPNDSGWASPLTYDVEFDTDTSSLPSGWSWVNQGSATYAAAWGAGVLTHPGISSGDDVKAIVRNLPTESAWSATLKLGLAGEDGATGLFTCGMVLRNATSGKMLLIGPRFVNAVAGNSTAVTTFAGFYFSSPTAFDSTAFATLGITGPYKYVRIQKVSGTSWSFYGSADGAVWQLFLSGHDVTAKFTPDQIGFAAYKASSAKTIATGCHFFRVR